MPTLETRALPAAPPVPPMPVLDAGLLRLEPLTVSHASAMYRLLHDPALRGWLQDPPPPSLQDLRITYALLEARRSPDGSEGWLNWVVREVGGPPMGTVQATVVPNDEAAWIGYVFGSAWWGRGHARAAVDAMLGQLARDGVGEARASVAAANARSIRLLEALGFVLQSGTAAAAHGLSRDERLYTRPLHSPA